MKSPASGQMNEYPYRDRYDLSKEGDAYDYGWRIGYWGYTWPVWEGPLELGWVYQAGYFDGKADRELYKLANSL